MARGGRWTSGLGGGKEKGICVGGERGWVEEEKLRGYPRFLGGRDRDGRSGITTRGR